MDLRVTYFDEVRPCTSPFGQLSLSIFVPYKNVIHMDVMYAANAVAIGGHMGIIPTQDRSIPNLETKKYPDHYVDRVVFCIKAWQ